MGFLKIGSRICECFFENVLWVVALRKQVQFRPGSIDKTTKVRRGGLPVIWDVVVNLFFVANQINGFNDSCNLLRFFFSTCPPPVVLLSLPICFIIIPRICFTSSFLLSLMLIYYMFYSLFYPLSHPLHRMAQPCTVFSPYSLILVMPIFILSY